MTDFHYRKWLEIAGNDPRAIHAIEYAKENEPWLLAFGMKFTPEQIVQIKSAFAAGEIAKGQKLIVDAMNED